jgi:RHS repeat-associated protein
MKLSIRPTHKETHSRVVRPARAVLAALCTLLILAWAVLPRFVTSTLAAGPIVIADPVPDQSDGLPSGTPTFLVYHTQTTAITYVSGFIVMSNCPDASCGNVADDAIRITVTRPDNTTEQVKFDFYTTEFPPIDLTPLFQPGVNSVTAELIDLMGPQYGSSHPFYLVEAVSPPVNALRVEPPPADTQFNYPWIYNLVSHDPVQTFTGSFSYLYTDIAIAGRGPVPVFTRAYNSNDTRIGPLGPGWTHNYDTRLVSPSAGSPDVVLVGPQGRSDLYTSSGGNSFTPPTGVQTTLQKNADGTYTAIHKDLTKWVFNALGSLIRIEDRYGNISVMSYNGDGELSSVSDPAGRGSLTFTYDGAGRLQSVSDWMTPARTVIFGYDGSGRLQSVTDREGNITQYAYDGGSQRLATITDSNGHVAVANSYDSEGRVQTQKDAEGLITGEQTTFSYNDNGDGTHTTTVTYPTTSYEPTWHHIEEDTYDSQGRITKHVSKPTSNSAEWITEEYTWDGQSNKTSETDGRGNTTNYCYDVDYAGAIVPGSRGNLTRLIEPPAESGAVRAVTLYKYDSKNNVIQTILPKGVSNGTAVGCGTDLSGSLNMQYATDASYDSATQTKLLSATTRFTDPDLGAQTAVTKFEYGDRNNPGRVTKVISPRGNTTPTPDDSFATTYDYYDTGSQAGMLQRQTDANGSITTYDYDEVGRQISMVNPLGNAPGGVPAQHKSFYTYDREDRLRFFIAPAPAPGSSSLITESRYDSVGNLTITLDANGQVKKNLYDVRDNLAEVQESPNAWTDPNVVPPGLIRTAYSYDSTGNLARVTRARADVTYERATDYSYDGLGRTRKETQYPGWPSTSGAIVTAFTYDKNSNKETLKDPLNRITTYGYDARNLVRSVTYSDGATPNVQYNYDLGGNRQRMQDGTGITSYAYDEQNRLLSVTSPSEWGPQTVAYRYDLDDNRRKITYPDGKVVTYAFDNGGRMQSLTDWQGRTASYTYYLDSNLKTVTNPNSTFSTYTYDNVGRLTDVWNRAGVNTISRHTYTVDNVGNRTRVEEVMPQNGAPKPPSPTRMLTTNYGYDRLYRLTSESSADVTATYTYDPVGNRLRMTKGRDNITYTYDRADRVTRIGSTAVTVDAVGNMVARGKETYTYDQANRLIRSRMPQPSQYIFNGDGVRVTTDAGQGPLSTHVYDTNRALPVLLYDGRRTYVWGVGLAFAAEGNGTMEIYHTDGLGSVRAVTYPNGNVTQNYQTDAFGVVVKRQGSSNQPFQFGGEERDKETEFIFLRTRNYDPSMGRLIQRDQFAGMISNPLSLNRYTYVENNPVLNVDPTGMSKSRVLGGRNQALLSPGRRFDLGYTSTRYPGLIFDYIVEYSGSATVYGDARVAVVGYGIVKVGSMEYDIFDRTVEATSGFVSARTNGEIGVSNQFNADGVIIETQVTVKGHYEFNPKLPNYNPGYGTNQALQTVTIGAAVIIIVVALAF